MPGGLDRLARPRCRKTGGGIIAEWSDGLQVRVASTLRCSSIIPHEQQCADDKWVVIEAHFPPSGERERSLHTRWRDVVDAVFHLASQATNGGCCQRCPDRTVPCSGICMRVGQEHLPDHRSSTAHGPARSCRPRSKPDRWRDRRSAGQNDRVQWTKATAGGPMIEIARMLGHRGSRITEWARAPSGLSAPCHRRLVCVVGTRWHRKRMAEFQENLERAKGFEPSTPTLARLGSTFAVAFSLLRVIHNRLKTRDFSIPVHCNGLPR